MPEQHACMKSEEIKLIREDLETIKIGMGYKEKYNGKFRAEVEDTDKNLNERLHSVEISTGKIESSLTSLKWILALVLPLFGALLIEILLKL